MILYKHDNEYHLHRCLLFRWLWARWNNNVSGGGGGGVGDGKRTDPHNPITVRSIDTSRGDRKRSVKALSLCAIIDVVYPVPPPLYVGSIRLRSSPGRAGTICIVH